MTTACLIAREERRAGDRVRDVVEVSLEKEVDTIRAQQGKMRDYLVQVRSLCGEETFLSLQSRTDSDLT